MDPSPERGWPNNYGAFADEIEAAGFADCVARRWRRTVVHTEREHQLGFAYAQLDNEALRAKLMGRLTRHRGQLRAGRAVSVEHRPEGSVVELANGDRVHAWMVIDATGAGAHFLEAPAAEPALQAAYGVVLEVDEHPFDLDTMVFMDFRDPGPVDSGPATFLYAMPLSSTRVFVEETSLARRPAVPLELLERRLWDRLAALGVPSGRVVDVEQCLIPMDLPLPTLPQRTVGFGAAARFVHPATGYQLVRALRTAPQLARTLARSRRAGRAPDATARKAWEVVVPSFVQRTRHLHTLGLGALLELDQAGTRTFFDAFFRVSPNSWRAYLDTTSRPASLMTCMARVYSELPGELRHLVASRAMGEGRRDLLGALTPRFGGAP